jgi:hypothetical protein
VLGTDAGACSRRTPAESWRRPAWQRLGPDGLRTGRRLGRVCGSDGLQEVKRWAGDEVEGGRADLGSWVVERGDGLRSGNLRGSRRPGGRNEGQPRDFGNWAESGHGPKGG